MRRLITILLLFFSLSIFGSQKLIVIHAYGGAKAALNKFCRSFEKEHFETENYSYHSVSLDLEILGKQLYNHIKESSIDTVSFVTHSMGALVVRSMLQYSNKDKDFPIIFRIVMIAPPNKGCEIADHYSSFKILKKILGPNIIHMKTDSNSLANQLPIPLESEVGIIVAISEKKLGSKSYIQGENDGYLTPERTTLGNEKATVIVDANHNTSARKKEVSDLVIEFLKYGKFISKDNDLHL